MRDVKPNVIGGGNSNVGGGEDYITIPGDPGSIITSDEGHRRGPHVAGPRWFIEGTTI